MKNKTDALMQRKIDDDDSESGNEDDGWDRRWNIGEQIAPDGNIINSNGLESVISQIHKLKKMPKDFKKIDNKASEILGTDKLRKSSVPSRMRDLMDELSPKYREMCFPGNSPKERMAFLFKARQATIGDGLNTDRASRFAINQ